MLLPTLPLHTSLILSLFCAILIGLGLGGPLVAYLRKLKAGQTVREEGPKSHYAKTGTPVMGGLLILFTAFISTFFFAPVGSLQVWIACLSIFFFAVIGSFDDIKKILKKHNAGLSSKAKFLLTLAVALDALLLLSTMSDPLVHTIVIPFSKTLIELPTFWWIILATLTILGSAHAGNLTDGLDGLASGAVIPIFIGLGVCAIIQSDPLLASTFHLPYIPGAESIATLCAGLIGGCIAFLWFNGNPATVFMGEIGSLSLGGAIGIISVILKQELLLIMMGGLLVVEALSVILQVGSYKLRNKKRIFKMAPIHHHFELLGWPEQKVTLRFWIISLLCSLFAMMTIFWI
jgi:phospho-N-acetylmuramoyl-pentapeptide-transferase